MDQWDSRGNPPRLKGPVYATSARAEQRLAETSNCYDESGKYEKRILKRSKYANALG